MIKYQVSDCNQIGFQLLLFLALILVTWQAASPQPIQETMQIHDKLGHALVFFFLALIVDHAFAKKLFNIKKFSWLLLYGFLLEWLQYYVPNRTFSMLDLAADGVGVLLYWLMFTYLFQRQPSKPKKSF